MIHCAVYKSSRKPDTYLYIERQDDFSRVPEALLSMLGPLAWVMDLELDVQRRLARADVEQVMAQLDDQGYFLQMPPPAHRRD